MFDVSPTIRTAEEDPVPEDSPPRDNPSSAHVNIIEPSDADFNEDIIDDENEGPKWPWWKIVILVVGILLVLLLLHAGLIALAGWRIYKGLPDSVRVEELTIDATKEEGINVSVKANISPSLLNNLFYVSVKRANVQFSLTELFSQPIVSVCVPALKIGGGHNTIDLAATPIQLQLSKGFSAKKLIDGIRNPTLDFSNLSEYTLKTQLDLDLSVFTFIAWLPIPFSRKMSIPLDIPFKPKPASPKKESGGAEMKLPIALDSVEFGSGDDFSVKAALALNLDILPVKIPLVLHLPELAIDIGAGKDKPETLLSVVLPDKTVNSKNPLEAAVEIKKASSPHWKSAIGSIAAGEHDLKVRVNGRSLGEKPAGLQKLLNNLEIEYSIGELVTMAKNAQRSMKVITEPQVNPPPTKIIETDAEKAASPLDIVRGELVSFAKHGDGARLYLAVHVLKKELLKISKDIPVNALKGEIPQLGASIRVMNEEVAGAGISLSENSDEKLTVSATVDVHNLKKVLQPVMMMMSIAKCSPIDRFPDDWKSIKDMQILLRGGNPTLDELLSLAALRVNIQQATVVFANYADIDLVQLLSSKADGNGVAEQQQTRTEMTKFLSDAKHDVTVSAVDSKENLRVEIKADLHPSAVSDKPRLAVSWPQLDLRLKTSDDKELVHVQLDKGSLNVSLDPGSSSPLALIHSKEKITAKAIIGEKSTPKEMAKTVADLAKFIFNSATPGELKLTGGTANSDVFTLTAPLPVQSIISYRTGWRKRLRIQPLPGVMRRFMNGAVSLSAVKVPHLMLQYSTEVPNCPDTNQQANNAIVNVTVDLPKLGAQVALQPGDIKLASAVLPKISLMGQIVNDAVLCGLRVIDHKDGSEAFQDHIPHLLDPGKNMMPSGHYMQIIPIIAELGIDAAAIQKLISGASVPEKLELSGLGGDGYVSSVVSFIGQELPIPLQPSQQPNDGSSQMHPLLAPGGLKLAEKMPHNPLKVFLDMNSPNHCSFEILAGIELPKKSDPPPLRDPSIPEYSPCLKIRQGPTSVRLAFTEADFIELALDRLLLPIRTEAAQPKDLEADYTERIQVKIRGEVSKADFGSRDVRKAVSHLLAGINGNPKTARPFKLITIVKPFNQHIGKEYKQVLDINREAFNGILQAVQPKIAALRHVELFKETPNGQKEEVDLGKKTAEEEALKALAGWIDLSVSVAPVPGYATGVLPCPLEQICPAPTTAELQGLVRATVRVDKLLPRITAMAAKTIPFALSPFVITPPTHFTLHVGLNQPLHVGVVVNGNVNLAKVVVNKFTLDAEASVQIPPDRFLDIAAAVPPESTLRKEERRENVAADTPELTQQHPIEVSVDVFVNTGDTALQSLLRPVRLLPIPELPGGPPLKEGGQPLCHPPLTVTLKSDVNLLGAMLTGAVPEISLGHVFNPPLPKSDQNKEGKKEKGAVGPRVIISAEEITQRQATLKVDIEDLPEIKMPTGISVPLGVVSVTVTYSGTDLIAASLPLNLSDRPITKLSMVTILNDGSRLGEMVSGIVEGKPTAVSINITVGGAKFTLPLALNRETLVKTHSLPEQIIAAISEAPSSRVLADQVTAKAPPPTPFLIPALPIYTDSLPHLIRSVIQSVAQCLFTKEPFFRLTSKFGLDQGQIPPEVLLRVGVELIGGNVRVALDRTHGYYFRHYKGPQVDKIVSNDLFIGQADCVGHLGRPKTVGSTKGAQESDKEQKSDEKATPKGMIKEASKGIIRRVSEGKLAAAKPQISESEFNSCTEANTIPIIYPRTDGHSEIPAHKVKPTVEAALNVADIIRDLTSIKSGGNPLESATNAASIAVGGTMRTSERLGLAISYTAIPHFIDAAINESGMCLRIENPSFMAIALRAPEGEHAFMIRVPLAASVPIPVSAWSDPCHARLPQSDYPLEKRTELLDGSNKTLSDFTLTGQDKPLGHVYLPDRLPARSSWQLNFTIEMTKAQKPKTEKGYQSCDLSVLLYPHDNQTGKATPASQPHKVLAVTLRPRYLGKLPEWRTYLKDLPYVHGLDELIARYTGTAHTLHQAGQLAKGVFGLVGLGSDGDQEEYVSTTPNTISVTVNNRLLYIDDLASEKIGGVFPPRAASVSVKMVYWGALKRLLIVCKDATGIDPRSYRTIFPLDIEKALKGDTPLTSYGMGLTAQRGGDADHQVDWKVRDVAFNVAEAALKATSLYYPPLGTDEPKTFYLMPRDVHNLPLGAGKSALKGVRLVEADDEAQNLACQALWMEPGVHRVTYTGELTPGRWHVEVTADGTNWTRLEEGINQQHLW